MNDILPATLSEDQLEMFSSARKKRKAHTATATVHENVEVKYYSNGR